MENKLKIVTSKHFPFKGYMAMTILCWMIVRKDLAHKVTSKVINHENIHYAQERELLFVGFYILYLVFFLVCLIVKFNWHLAYRANPFEKEAYANEGDMSYLDKRKHFAWIKVFYT